MKLLSFYLLPGPFDEEFEKVGVATRQHWDLPNMMRYLSFDSDLGKFKKMLNPNNYAENKKIFLKGEKLLKLLPQPSIIISA